MPWIPVSRRTLLVAASIAFLAIGGLMVWRHKTGPYHFLVVTRGEVYRSGFMHGYNLEKALDSYGIRTVLNVSEEREKKKPDWGYADEVRICREKGVALVEMPILSGVPPDDAQIARWLAILDEPARLPVLIHCDHGVMRTGMLVAVYEMEKLGKSNRQALADMPMFGHSLEEPHKRPMKQFVLDYVTRRRRP